MATSARHEESLAWYTRAVETVTPVMHKRPQYGDAREKFCSAHGSRAQALTHFERFAEAVLDYDQMIERALPKDRNWYRLLRADCLARLGDHHCSMAEVEAVADQTTQADHWYFWGCVASLASASV